jgi:hypothetical protein
MEREPHISSIENLPARLASLVSGASDKQLSRPYKAGGWNARQVIHHLADSHMHSYLRCKKIVAEDHPTLQPYDQDVWAAMHDANTCPTGHSLLILQGLHARWTAFFRSLPDSAWTRTAFHPERGDVTLESMLTLYAAHGEGHLVHVSIGIRE